MKQIAIITLLGALIAHVTHASGLNTSISLNPPRLLVTGGETNRYEVLATTNLNNWYVKTQAVNQPVVLLSLIPHPSAGTNSYGSTNTTIPDPTDTNNWNVDADAITISSTKEFFSTYAWEDYDADGHSDAEETLVLNTHTNIPDSSPPEFQYITIESTNGDKVLIQGRVNERMRSIKMEIVQPDQTKIQLIGWGSASYAHLDSNLKIAFLADFSFNSVALQSGSNFITITIRDLAGYFKTTNFVYNFQPQKKFIQPTTSNIKSSGRSMLVIINSHAFAEFYMESWSSNRNSFKQSQTSSKIGTLDGDGSCNVDAYFEIDYNSTNVPPDTCTGTYEGTLSHGMNLTSSSGNYCFIMWPLITYPITSEFCSYSRSSTYDIPPYSSMSDVDSYIRTAGSSTMAYFQNNADGYSAIYKWYVNTSKMSEARGDEHYDGTIPYSEVTLCGKTPSVNGAVYATVPSSGSLDITPSFTGTNAWCGYSVVGYEVFVGAATPNGYPIRLNPTLTMTNSLTDININGGMIVSFNGDNSTPVMVKFTCSGSSTGPILKSMTNPSGGNTFYNDPVFIGSGAGEIDGHPGDTVTVDFVDVVDHESLGKTYSFVLSE